MPTSLQISEAELQVLNYERYHQNLPLIQSRLHAVYAKATMGFSNEVIGTLLGIHPHTVGRSISIYKSEGIEGLLTTGYGTNKSILDPYADEILDSFKQSPPLNVNQARERIAQISGITRSPTRIKAFMKRHGIKYRKLGHIPGKADPHKQQTWLENDLQPHLEQAQAGKRHLFFMDAAHFVWGAFICSVWSVVRCFIKSGTGRNRINVLGLVNAISCEVTYTYNTAYINAEVIIEFLYQFKKKISDLPITIVLDNARYQHCKAVKQVANQLGITLLFLPAYSPNLNLIERLWKFAKKKVLYGKYYPTADEFHTAVITFFEGINTQNLNELKSLITLNFQSFENQRIYQV